MRYSLNPRKSVIRVIFMGVWFSVKSFSRVMGLLFGSAGAHTYPKSEQVPLEEFCSDSKGHVNAGRAVRAVLLIYFPREVLQDIIHRISSKK